MIRATARSIRSRASFFDGLDVLRGVVLALQVRDAPAQYRVGSVGYSLLLDESQELLGRRTERLEPLTELDEL
jgi:hypothetical protein